MTELHNDCQYWAGKRPSFLGLMAKYSPFLPSQPHSPTVFFLLQETTNDDLGLSIAKDTCPQTNGRCQAWKRQFFERAQFLIVTSFQFSSWYSTTGSLQSVKTAFWQVCKQSLKWPLHVQVRVSSPLVCDSILPSWNCQEPNTRQQTPVVLRLHCWWQCGKRWRDLWKSPPVHRSACGGDKMSLFVGVFYLLSWGEPLPVRLVILT